MITYEMEDQDDWGQYMRATYSDGVTAEIVVKELIHIGHRYDYITAILECAAECRDAIEWELERHEERLDARDRWARGEL